MNDKRAKLLRRVAIRQTVGQPHAEYRRVYKHLKRNDSGAPYAAVRNARKAYFAAAGAAA